MPSLDTPNAAGSTTRQPSDEAGASGEKAGDTRVHETISSDSKPDSEKETSEGAATLHDRDDIFSQKSMKDQGSRNQGMYMNRPLERTEGMSVSTWPNISHLSISKPELSNALRQIGQQVQRRGIISGEADPRDDNPKEELRAKDPYQIYELQQVYPREASFPSSEKATAYKCYLHVLLDTWHPGDSGQIRSIKKRVEIPRFPHKGLFGRPIFCVHSKGSDLRKHSKFSVNQRKTTVDPAQGEPNP
ncbi:hypothetical protein IGI04_035896 [Brassica rapa subsp. trilocularis]|uniref:DUF4283 domain-containing protein n=1 Tax=Brassica rapa subsp. trilocularis TaxID=1813537 RepID=A0ABQ7LGP8_BRACM|nr:hypothetical protein IGI04_035896 [Brassica rapa subsp. trilocularis]